MFVCIFSKLVGVRKEIGEFDKKMKLDQEVYQDEQTIFI